MTLSWEQVRKWRVARHHLDRRVPRSRLFDVLRATGGIHAQVQSSAELQLWARVNGVTRAEVRDALWSERSLVRTWCMRGTLHLLTAEDLPLYVAALRQHDRWWKGAWLRMVGMTEEELRASLEAIRGSLGARPVTRERLAEKVVAKVGPKGRKWMMSGWGEMLKPAAFHGYLCSGPPRGQSATFVRPDRWLAEWSVPDAARAWREIVRRYFRAYGPATREEFARWWGMQPAAAGRAMKTAGVKLAEVDVEGSSARFPAKDLSALGRIRPRTSVRLLPGFDVFVVGNRPRASLVDARFEHLVYRKAGWISPVVLIDGRAAGVWSHDRKGAGIEVSVQPFGKVSTAHRKAITQEGDRLGRFLDSPATVTFVRRGA